MRRTRGRRRMRFRVRRRGVFGRRRRRFGRRRGGARRVRIGFRM